MCFGLALFTKVAFGVGARRIEMPEAHGLEAIGVIEIGQYLFEYRL